MLLFSPGAKLEPGKNYQYLFSMGTNVGTVKKVNLRWDYIVNPLDASTWCSAFCNKKLYVNSVTISCLNSYPETYDCFETFIAILLIVKVVVSILI